MPIRSFLLVLLVAATSAAERVPLGGGLASLAEPHRGRAMHASSADPTGGNQDFRVVAPGESITLLDYRGAGIVRRFWVTFYPRPPLAPPENVIAAHRQNILRMYWDDESTPSVEVPLGDFFGVGFGEHRDYVSLPLAQTSGGYVCYWPMPFHRAARWTLTNQSGASLIFYWNIDFVAQRALPKNVRLFHAQWRRQNPTKPGRSYVILEARGEGHYVGTALFMHGLASVPVLGSLGFLEGDEQITIDDAPAPSIAGTGTEDYFNGGFYFESGPIAGPYAGVVIKDPAAARISAYRWHIEDAIPFTRSIRVAIEHGPTNDVPADYSSVAFFYQREPHASFPALPAAAALLP